MTRRWLALPLLGAAALWGPLLWRWTEAWRASPDQTFGWFVPLLALYLGGIEVVDGLAIEAKVAATAHRVTDLTSENISTDDAAIRRILKDSAAMIAPYSATPLVVTISEISTDEAGNATVTWSDSLHGTAHPAGQAVTLPPALAGQPNMSLILGEASYQFTPRFGSALTGTLTLSDRYYLFPSHSTGVARVTS